MRRTRIGLVGAVALAAGLAGTAQAGGTGGSTTVTPIADGLAGPLQIAVERSGSILVGQDFAGLLSRVAKDGSVTTLATNPGGSISGVDPGRRGAIYYTTSTGGPPAGITSSKLQVLRDGTSSVVADLLAYEQANNPDQKNTYGFRGISDSCAAQLPDELQPATYTGQVDSHAYAVAAGRYGVFVADAGGNDILGVSPQGQVRTIAVLRPQRLKVTADLAAGQHLPDCTIGLTYRFEPVPTDVEIGRDGRLYVTTLPGGPEGTALPPRGAVWRINPWTGASRRLAGGLAGASNLALGDRGEIYVTELFGNRVTRVTPWGTTPVTTLTSPAAVEAGRGRLTVSYDVFANGTVATIGRGYGHGWENGHKDRAPGSARAH